MAKLLNTLNNYRTLNKTKIADFLLKETLRKVKISCIEFIY
jgi:hypothetical protein